ncbi:MAG TPA: serine/threonine-protein kinase [Gemmatimonadales bacterium]|nr:serine/threonine-protein kinase [Gemmatimonadales bacterium]
MTATTPSDAHLLPALAARFRVARELGRGGMGTVYLAHDTSLERDVAIKLLNPQVSAAVGAERFTREIRLTARLVHPNIVPLFDSGRVPSPGGDPDRLYYVMPFIDGLPLRARLRLESRLAVAEVLRIVADVAEALAYAHAMGAVHRDVKPENVFWYRGRALLGDFGIALSSQEQESWRMTQTGIVVGSPAYISPEQAEDQPLDGRSDLYSLGCVAFELLAGAPPYTAESPFALVAAHLTRKVPSVRERRPEVPLLLDALVARLMAKEPGERPANAAALLEELRALEAGTGAVAPPAVAPPPRPPTRSIEEAIGLPPDAAALHRKARQLFSISVQGGAGARDKYAMAKAYLERALQQAPDHPLLLATMGDVIHVEGVRGLRDRREALTRAQDLWYRALSLDESIGSLHSSLGVHLLYWVDEFDLAGEELKRGVELSPDVAESHRYYGAWLKIAGRPDDALVEMREAVQLAPNAPFMRVGEADVLMALGRYDEAAGSLRHALRLLPRYEAALERLEMSCHRAGRHEEALDARSALLGVRGESARVAELVERTARDGWLAAREHDLRTELADLLARAEREDPFTDPNTSRQLADRVIIVLAELGEWTEAMTWVERGYHRRPGRLRRVLMDLPYDHHGLAVDPRYARLLRTAGLAELMAQ